MSYEIRRREGLTLVGISLRTTNAEEMRGGKISGVWKRFLEGDLREQIAHRTFPNETHAAYLEYESDYTGEYTFLLGAAVSDASRLPEGMVAKRLPPSRYAVFRSESPAQVPAAWQRIWKTELKRTYTGDFEVYRSRDGAPLAIEIFVAIE